MIAKLIQIKFTFVFVYAFLFSLSVFFVSMLQIKVVYYIIYSNHYITKLPENVLTLEQSFLAMLACTLDDQEQCVPANELFDCDFQPNKVLEPKISADFRGQLDHRESTDERK